MTDTPAHIYQKQYEIIASKPMTERIQLGLDSIDSARQWIENSIRQSSPNINKTDFAIALFMRYYQNDFSETQTRQIIQSIRAYYEKA